MRKGDPDRGPKMIEGVIPFDKGYTSDNETFSPKDSFPADQERGNAYFEMRNAAYRKDSAKLERSKFSKYA